MMMMMVMLVRVVMMIVLLVMMTMMVDHLRQVMASQGHLGSYHLL